MQECYYLHENGELIYKRFWPDDDSPFVKKIWPMDVSNRSNAWMILIEGIALGARIDRVAELAEHWHCDIKDMVEFMRRNPKADDLQKRGLHLLIENVFGLNYDQFMNWLATTPNGQDPDWESWEQLQQEGSKS